MWKKEDVAYLPYFFSQGYSLYFFLILAHLWSFGVWRFGVGSYIGVFWVGVFSWWGLGPVVWGLLVFLGWGSLYKHKRITLGEKMIRAPLPILCHSGLFGSVTIFGYFYFDICPHNLFSHFHSLA